MPRKTFTIIVLVFLLLGAVLVGGYLYFFTGTFGDNTDSEGSGGTNLIGNFLPFGKQPTGNTSENTEFNQISNNSQEAPKLLKLVQNPVAGFIPTTLGSTTIVRYVEKETGHILDIDMSIPAARTRITNTTIPRVYQAIFGPSGQSVILRYLNNDNSIQTYSAVIPRATSTDSFRNGVDIKGVFLTENIVDLSASPAGTKIFTLVNFGRSSVGTVSDINGGKKSQIFDSPFTEWLSSWTNEKTILLATKPSSAALGYLYLLDSVSGNFQKVYGGTAGLTALLSPDGKSILISESNEGQPSLKIYTASTRRIDNLGLKTIADKCVWAANTRIYCAVPDSIPRADGGYPDSWYQGAAFFSDSIWEIDTEILSTDKILDISQTSREDIDAINLSQDKNGGYLFFINKKDNSLWSLKLR